MLITSFKNKSKRYHRLIYIFMLLITAPVFAQNQVFWVSTTGNDTLDGSQASPFATITYALSVIGDQDTIRIEPGYYYEQLDISGLTGFNDFVMQGASLTDTTAIVSLNPGPVMSIGMPLSNQTQIMNLLLTHTNPDSLGPGIEIFSSNPIIENCTITGNNDNNPGGGIRIYSSGSVETPVIRDCRIHDNTALGGGGIFAQASSVVIKHSIIEFNDALGYEGGGIFLQGCSGSTIAENQIHANHGLQ
ncbi:MAG: right-handed parallel beta-helix repeat-containing protein [Calditrichaceae bacterium]